MRRASPPNCKPSPLTAAKVGDVASARILGGAYVPEAGSIVPAEPVELSLATSSYTVPGMPAVRPHASPDAAPTRCHCRLVRPCRAPAHSNVIPREQVFEGGLQSFFPSFPWR